MITTCVWRPEGNFLELVLSFHHGIWELNSGPWAWVTRDDSTGVQLDELMSLIGVRVGEWLTDSYTPERDGSQQLLNTSMSLGRDRTLCKSRSPPWLLGMLVVSAWWVSLEGDHSYSDFNLCALITVLSIAVKKHWPCSSWKHLDGGLLTASEVCSLSSK